MNRPLNSSSQISTCADYEKQILFHLATGPCHTVSKQLLIIHLISNFSRLTMSQTNVATSNALCDTKKRNLDHKIYTASQSLTNAHRTEIS